MKEKAVALTLIGASFIGLGTAAVLAFPAPTEYGDGCYANASDPDWIICPDSQYPADSTIPVCATEDSDNCYWDATSMGNGTGRSFTVVNGIVTFH